MTRALRKLNLTAHVTSSVGWLGAVAAYLVLAAAGLTSRDTQVVHSVYLAMELIGWSVIVPLSLASLLTGLVQSLGTEWGLFRHYWILVKLVLTVGAVTILLLHMPAVGRRAGAASELIHGGGGLLVLLTTTTLSVYKPWGRTRYGRRTSRPDSNDDAGAGSGRGSTTGTPWGLYVLLGTIGLILLFVVLHFAGGHGGHGH